MKKKEKSTSTSNGTEVSERERAREEELYRMGFVEEGVQAKKKKKNDDPGAQVSNLYQAQQGHKPRG